MKLELKLEHGKPSSQGVSQTGWSHPKTEATVCDDILYGCTKMSGWQTSLEKQHITGEARHHWRSKPKSWPLHITQPKLLNWESGKFEHWRTVPMHSIFKKSYPSKYKVLAFFARGKKRHYSNFLQPRHVDWFFLQNMSNDVSFFCGKNKYRTWIFSWKCHLGSAFDRNIIDPKTRYNGDSQK